MVLQIHMPNIIILTIFIEIFVYCQSQFTPGTCGIKPSSCWPKAKYRSFDGSCNNLKNPTWGMTGTRYHRLLPSNYANGIDHPTVSQCGNPLPEARKVSYVLYPDKPIEDPCFTLIAMQYGQVIAHDMSMTMGNNQTKQSDKCCSKEGQLLPNSCDPKQCYPILIPKNDPVYSELQCFGFERTGTDRDFGCGIPNRPVQQLTRVNHYMDGSLVYGQNENDSNELRLFKGGKLKFEARNGQCWLPRNKNVTRTCTVVDPKEPCYMAGDVRLNQSPQLTILHTVLLREHNRIAEILAELNPHWDDERLFQEARKICIAQHQHIVYNEWLPIFLGEENVLKKGISYKTKGCVNDYDSSVDVSTSNEFATAAFRFFHSNIVGVLGLYNEQREREGALRLSDHFNRPAVIERDNVTFDELTIGMATQHQYASDVYHDKEITINLNRPIGKNVGQDLKAICVQRNRDHGLASYNDFREYCGLKRANKFEDLEDEISKDNIKKLKSLYNHVGDIDLTVGGSLERLVRGTQVGPTFLFIITEQFYRTRVGDRFFYENCGETGFTLDQLNEIRKSCISRILCANTGIKIIQPQGFRKICEATCGIKPSSCSESKYRSYDGSCNNLKNPTWGMTGTRYGRLLPPNYGNVIDYPTLAKSGNPLPKARKVSFTVYPDKPIKDPSYTLLAMQYGQIITHDMSMTKDNNQTKQLTGICCSNEGQFLRSPNYPEFCYPILIPKNDPVYSKLNIGCFEFQRTGIDREYGCGIPNQPVQQLSRVNQYLDLSLVYGQNVNDSISVRLFQGGKLIFEKRNGQFWLPRNENVSGTCTVVDPKEPCYRAGDIRLNQTPHLAIFHTILLREHNRMAEILAGLNPHWDDEKIFQEARKIFIAQQQNIIYNEWLPIFLGEENVLKKGISYKTKGYVNDYNSTVDPSVSNEHATAAFRFFHSNIAGRLLLLNEKRKNEGDLRLSDHYNRPAVIEKNAAFDELTIGLVTQPQLFSDEYHDKEITNYWIRPIGKKIGQDLKAICIQRNRDHGLASYNDLREYCGLKRAVKFKDFKNEISKENVKKLKSLYEHVDDVDLTVGGSLEELVEGTQAGPTFLCIITDQFYRTRVGDRFFYENSGETGFTLLQLNELRKASISRLLCDNIEVKTIQPKGFRKISATNKVIPCSDLPSTNLTLWKEN